MTDHGEGQNPIPESSMEASATSPEEAILKEFFDEHYYRQHYPEDVPPDQDAFSHFMTVGWRAGYNPSADFDTRFYLDSNPDVSSASLNPLEHYALSGRSEGRPARPPVQDNPSPPDDALISGMDVVAADFDPEFYRRHNPDISGSDEDLLRHFMTSGWREKRDPSPDFDVGYYLWANPDVAAADINPLLHYRLHVATEIRPRLQPHAMERAVLRNCQAVQDRKPLWQLPEQEKAVDEEYLTFFLERARKDQNQGAGLVVSISHDDYRLVPAGVWNCVRDEAQAFSFHQWAYLHLFPSCAIPMLAPLHQGEFVASLNGQYIGRVAVDTLLKVLAAQQVHYPIRHLVIHNLLGVVPECIPVIAQQMRVQKSIFWVHDFSTICPSHTLMRNDIAFCDAPAPTSPACQICAYGEEREAHLHRVRKLFEALHPEVMAPSRYMLSFWQEKTDLPIAGISVQEHAFITARVPVESRSTSILKIGFMGSPVFHKGWDIYQKLAARFAGDQRYEFFYLGSMAQDIANITSLSETLMQDDRDALQKCILRNRIDVIVNCSRSPEAFCLEAYEAIAAGAFLLAPQKSGNVEDLLTSSGNTFGHVVRDEKDLTDLFNTGEIASLVAGSCRATGSLVIRSGTFSYLVPEAAH
ncbi:MAG: hypothetical protein ABF459_12795 [Gluconobacter cerinus]|uniref:hypothetical protein n=1 Tax=Gluconobacter cerinus TaxID=38307 RepID=UPI0039ED3A25